MRLGNFDNFDRINEGTQGGGNKFILVRFGSTPDMRVTHLFADIAIKNPKPVAMKGPGSIITMFETPKTKEALVSAFDGLGISYNLYQVVHTSAGGAGPELVARKPNKEQLKAKLKAALAADDFETAATLRDQIAELEGRPSMAPGNAAAESQVYRFEAFLLEFEEEEEDEDMDEFFYMLISKLVDHELAELETETEDGITKEECQKIRDYLVQNDCYVENPNTPKK
jgi:hypothetical protein